MKTIRQIAQLFILLLAVSCSNNDTPDTPDQSLAAPHSIQITTDDAKASISGKADAGSEVTLRYKAPNGQIARKVEADASGSFSTQIDLLVDYEQELVAFASKNDETSEMVILDKIPAKAAYSGGFDVAKEILVSHRWKSDQTQSRTIIKQSSATPPYDMFATTAQKYFDFKPDGGFHFEVTAPLQFTHTSGSWSMTDKGIIEISTMIPLGPMKITDAKIQHLDEQHLSLLVKISDGLFLLSFTSETIDNQMI